jgi:hypothetical protein
VDSFLIHLLLLVKFQSFLLLSEIAGVL